MHTYQKDNGNTVVALVDVAGGARVKMLQYQAPENQKINCHYTFYRNFIQYWWDQMPSNSSRVLVMNGQFFNPDKDPTTLSFAIKDNGHVYHSGDPNEAGGKGRQLNVYPNNVTVTPTPDGNYVEHHAHTAILGENINLVKRAGSRLGRTYVCAKNIGSRNVLLMYVTKAKRSSEANSDLSSWGCYENNTVALDGSGSTQLRTRGGKKLIGNGGERTIPQVIGIYNNANWLVVV